MSRLVLDKNNIQLKDSYMAIPSKSVAHRALICAAFSDAPTRIECPYYGDDVKTTAEALRVLGADIEETGYGFFVRPVERTWVETETGLDAETGEEIAEPQGYHDMPGFKDGHKAVIDCRNSGTTYRFFDEICKELGIDYELTGSPRLIERVTSGVPTSQSFSGTILAIGLRPYGIDIELEGIEMMPSKPYIELTIKVMCEFGCSGYQSPECYEVEGDWSLAAFVLALGAVDPTGKGVKVTGLDTESGQGDRRIVDILRDFGCRVVTTENAVSVKPPIDGVLHGIGHIDMLDTPDLVPVVGALAAQAEGDTMLENVMFLRLKESDRVKAVCDMINEVGGFAVSDESRIAISGCPGGVHGSLHDGQEAEGLHGGKITTYNDHRIAMAAAVLAMGVGGNSEGADTGTTGQIEIDNPDCVTKSYPNFWKEIMK